MKYDRNFLQDNKIYYLILLPFLLLVPKSNRKDDNLLIRNRLKYLKNKYHI